MKYAGLTSLLAIVLMAFVRPSVSDDPFVVAIDPAHGGADKGAVSQRGVNEKDITWSIAREIEQLGRERGLQVVLTRSADETVLLDERTALVNQSSADLLISLHVNSHPGDASRTGIQLFVNKDNGYYHGSMHLASVVAEEVVGLGALHVSEATAANFRVLKNSHCPSLMIQLGYLTNEHDADFIAQPANQRAIAERIVSSLLKLKP